MSNEQSNAIISELYDLVASPEQYDKFMVQLQSKLETMRSDGRSGEAGKILEHMSRAASLVDIVTPWRRETDENLHKALAQRMQATLALDEAGNIIDANSAAKVVFDLVPGDDLSEFPIEPEELQRLRMRVQQTVVHPDAVNQPNDVLRLHNTQTSRPLLIRVEPYVHETTKRRFAILRTSDIGWPSHLGSILQDLFDLSRAEVDVVRLLVEGLKVKEIAARRRASTTTIRSQLQSIFGKTDTKDQMGCVRMVFGLSLMHDIDEGNLVAARIEAANQTALFPREDQRHVVGLPDGRRLEYSDFGAKEGPCILWYHDQAYRSRTRSADDVKTDWSDDRSCGSEPTCSRS